MAETPDETPPAASTTTTLGRYVLERRIASGGMADVYLARNVGAYGFVKRVALKVLKRDIAGDDENVRMFIREALVSAEFRHTNLAQVYEVGELHGRLFIAMELVRGVSVASLLKGLAERHKAMPLNVAVRIAIDTLDGLGHAHEAQGTDGRALGLVHRDVSPQNIMVAVDGAVKVVDFGIARVDARGAVMATQAPKIKGKFSYMAPEQWDPRAPLDARADLFALGVVLYEMTTGGARLFRGDTPKDIYRAVVIDPIPDPRTRVPDYPEGLARIVMRALERGPNARWTSARSMRAALLEFAQGENWSLTSRVVSDTLRAAIGQGEIESRWEPVGENAAALGLVDETTAVDVEGAGAVPGATRTPTAETVPGKARRGDAALAAGGAPRGASPTRALVGVTAAALAATVAGIVGFAIGRRIEAGAASVRTAQAVARARTELAAHAPVALRVYGFEAVAGAHELEARFADAHPEAALALAPSSSADAIDALIEDRADVALVLGEPDAAALARAAAQRVDLGPASRVRVGRAVAVIVVNSTNPVATLSLEQARTLFRAPPADWDALGTPGVGALRVIERAPAGDLLALADGTLLGATHPPAGVESVPGAEPARRLVADDPHAVTLLALGDADGSVRVVPIAPDGTDPPLSYPLVAITRGPARRELRALIDWLRAPELDALLRARGVAR